MNAPTLHHPLADVLTLNSIAGQRDALENSACVFDLLSDLFGSEVWCASCENPQDAALCLLVSVTLLACLDSRRKGSTRRDSWHSRAGVLVHEAKTPNPVLPSTHPSCG